MTADIPSFAISYEPDLKSSSSVPASAAQFFASQPSLGPFSIGISNNEQLTELDSLSEIFVANPAAADFLSELRLQYDSRASPFLLVFFFSIAHIFYLACFSQVTML